VNIPSLPALQIYSKENKKHPINFNGEFTVLEVTKFIQENLSDEDSASSKKDEL